MIVEEWQAKKLYINKAQLETALGVSLDELPAKSFSYDEPLPDFLIPYCSMEFFDIEDAIALLVGENPSKFIARKYDFYGIKNAISQAIASGQLGDSEIIQDYYDELNGSEFYQYRIEHKAIEKWAKHYGYKWELPPYRPLITEPDTITNDNNADEIARLKAIIEQQTETIARLEAEIENLKKPETAQSTVDYDEFSIYGHTSENIEMLFHLCEKISNLCDPDNPHSYPDKKEIEEYIKKYHSDSSKLAEAIYQVITPNKVKQRGRKPNGVDTFKGFI